MGNTITTTIAIRAASLGMFATVSAMLAPIVAAFWASIFTFVMMAFSRACREYRRWSSIYSMDWYQSFQYAKQRNSPIVASTGREMGRTILKNIVNCLAPSILADSISSSGTVVLKKVLQITTLKEETASGSISAHTVSFRHSSWEVIK